MKASQLALLTGGKLEGADVEFNGLSTDSRTIIPGNLFIANKGETLDGHDYIQPALEKGATVALVTRKQPIPITQIIVPDTYQALGTWAAKHRAQLPSLEVIAVTGSCGKTTTKQMLGSIFSEVGPTIAATGSYNNHVGVPVTLLSLTPEHRFAIIEMGANHPHEIAPLTQMAKPDVAIITIIAPVHTEGFGDVDTIAETKTEIFDGLNPNGTAIINADDAYYPYWQKKLTAPRHCERSEAIQVHRVLSFSSQNKADVYATDIQLKSGCAAFLLHTPYGEVPIQLPILGRHNVANALAGASAAVALKVPLDKIAHGLAHMQSAKHRLHVCRGYNQALIIDDAYNANPLAVKAALDILAEHPGEKVWVFFDMKELGNLAIEAHQEVGRFAKQKGVSRIFALGELSQLTVEAFGEGAEHFANKKALIDALKPQLHQNMTILIKGSRSGALEEVVQALME